MSIKGFFEKQSESLFTGGGGDRMDFLRKPRKGEAKRKFVGRFYLVCDNEGQEMPTFCYRQHGFGRGSEVCPRMFDSEAYCERCEASSIEYAAGNKEAGRENLPKRAYWWCFVPRMSEYDEKPFIFDIPYGATQQIFACLALMGGWTSPEANLSDPDCVNALEKGIRKCFGNKGHDFIVDYNPNAPGRGVWTNFKFSSRPAKTLQHDFETPNMEEKFRLIKKLDQDSEPKYTEPSAPPPDLSAMSLKDLKAYAKTLGVKLGKARSKAAIIQKIEEAS